MADNTFEYTPKEETLSDIILLKRVQNGDMGALPMLSERYHPLVVEVASSLAGGRNTIEFDPALVSTIVAFNTLASKCKHPQTFGSDIEVDLFTEAETLYRKAKEFQSLPFIELEKKAHKGDMLAMCILNRRKSASLRPHRDFSFITGSLLMEGATSSSSPSTTERRCLADSFIPALKSAKDAFKKAVASARNPQKK